MLLFHIFNTETIDRSIVFKTIDCRWTIYWQFKQLSRNFWLDVAYWTNYGNCYAWSSGVIVAIEKPGFFCQNFKNFMISKFSKKFQNFKKKIQKFIKNKIKILKFKISKFSQNFHQILKFQKISKFQKFPKNSKFS